MSRIPPIAQLLHRVSNGLRYDGAVAVAMRLLFKACSPVAEVSLQVLLAKELGEPLPVLSARVPLLIRQATEADIPKLVAELDEDTRNGSPTARLAARRQLEKLYLDRLHRGERCFIATSAGRLAHMNWSCFRWGECFTGLPIVLEDGEVYTTDGFTLPAWRGQRIHEAVLNDMLRCAAAAGCKRAYTFHAFDNVRPQRGLVRVGWYTYGIGLYVRFRGTRKILLFCLRGSFDPLLRSLPAEQTGGSPPA